MDGASGFASFLFFVEKRFNTEGTEEEHRGRREIDKELDEEVVEAAAPEG